jgi:capsular polysaccharide biosynthesis protein
LLVPTTSCAYGLLDGTSCQKAWSKLSQKLAYTHSECSSDLPTPERIFVSRRNWKGNAKRPLKNFAEVEERFIAAGFAVVSPEKLCFSDQRKLFAGAKIIAGEDGSGMYNSIYSEPGTRIGLIAMGRINTLQAATANALDHSVTYIGAEPISEEEDGGYVADMAMIDSAIQLLLD